MSNKNDNVYHPKHYEIPGLPVESIVIIRAILGEEGFNKFCRGNALKYLIRADNKGGVEDLKKARVYLNWEIGSEDEPERAAEEPAEEPDVMAAAVALKKYCETIVGEEELHCYDCKFYDGTKQYSCRCHHLPYVWELPQEGDDEE